MLLLLALIGGAAAKSVLLDFDVHRGLSLETARRGAQPYALMKRSDGYDEMVLQNEQTFYLTSLLLGLNGQNVLALVDTGSLDLWVQGSDNVYCSSNGGSLSGSIDCSEYGVFDYSKSSLWVLNNTAFSISYADTTAASGLWGHDTLEIGGLKVENFLFAVANVSNSSISVLGIGLPGLEVTYAYASLGDAYMYQNLPLKMKADGVIDHALYLLYLGEYSSSLGSVLFGAIDHDKYTGVLQTVPVVQAVQGYPVLTRLLVDLEDIKLGTTLILLSATTALLDLGSTYCYLPSATVLTLVLTLDISYSSSVGGYLATCNKIPSVNLTFAFDGFNLDVPVENFFIPVSYTNGRSSGLCLLGMGTSTSVVLGDLFLRLVYAVFDIENEQISMARANWDSNGADIEVVLTGVGLAVSGSGTATSHRAGASATSASSSKTHSALSGGVSVTATVSMMLAWASVLLLAV